MEKQLVVKSVIPKNIYVKTTQELSFKQMVQSEKCMTGNMKKFLITRQIITEKGLRLINQIGKQ